MFCSLRVRLARFPALLLVLSLAVSVLPAQPVATPGKLRGQVINRATGLPVALATVTVDDNGPSASSDGNGYYEVVDIAPGLHRVTVTKEGVGSAIVTEVEIDAGTSLSLDLPLEPTTTDVVQMEAFTVAADVLENSDIGLLLGRQKAAGISDAIGAEQFGRLGTSNAAEALGRVTGASVVDGKYVLIRGLGDRYSNTLMNGVSVPSADPDKRAVQMDQFPADLIESIVTTKSFTPDQPGAFSGGSVDIRTKSFPESFFYSVGASTDYVTGVTGEDVLRIPGGGRDWAALDDGTRDLPVVQQDLPNRRAAEIAARAGDLAPARALDQASRQFDNRSYYPTTRSAPLNWGFNLALGDRIEWDDARLFGYTLSLTYDRNTAHSTGGTLAKYGGTDDLVQRLLVYSPEPTDLSFGLEDVPAGTPRFGLTDTVHEVSWGAFLKLAFRPVLEHELSLDLFHSQSASDRIRRGVGEEVENYATSIYEAYDLLYTERGITSAQLKGSSTFSGAREVKLDWRLAHSQSTQDQPDYRTLAWLYDLQGNDVNATIAQPSRFFRFLDESSTEAGADLTLPLAFANGEGRLKAGFVASTGERDYVERRFRWTQRPRSRNELVNFPGPIGILSESASGITLGNTIERQEEPNQYTAEQTIEAAYAMLDWPVAPQWRVITGVRAEGTEIQTIPIKLPNRAISDARINDQDWLPALSVVFAPSPRVNWRAAYGRTIARPTYKELADIRYEDVFLDLVFAGNAALGLTVIDNFDLRWEWFPRRGETVAISAFHKRLRDPIEVVYNAAIGAIQPDNVDRAEVTGVEFEFRRDLGFLGETWSAFSVGANLALIESKAKIPADELAVLRAFDPQARDTRELIGQSPYTLNLDLSYDHVATGTAVTAAFNVVGERLDLVQFGPLGDVFEQSAPNLTVTLTQRLGDRWRARLTAKNLLRPDFERSFDSSSGTRVWERHTTSASFGVSLTYLFE